MQKAKKNTKVLFCALVFALLSVIMLTLVPTTVPTLADNEIFSNTLASVSMNVNAFDKNHATVSPITKDVTIQGEGISETRESKSYSWSKVKYFEVTMGGLETLADKTDGVQYEYKYNVTYFPQRIINGKIEYDLEANTPVTIYSNSAETKAAIKNKFYFFVDNNESMYKTSTMSGAKVATVGAVSENEEGVLTSVFGDTYLNQGGWGVYVFTFSCDGETSGEFVYELTPTSLSELKDEVLEVKYDIVNSSFSLNNAYLFTVNEPFQYVNREYISWSIKGEGSDGTKYVSFDNEKTADNETALYTGTDIKNTGATFKFDKNIQGNWTATATIKEGELERKATSEQVSTIKPFSTTAIIIIVSVVTVVAVAIVSVIIVVTIKKEKTW